jgi:hypothetical protein
MAENDVQLLSLEAFSRLLGGRFAVHAGAGKSCEVELIEAVGGPTPQQTGKLESFSLVFRGPRAQALSQGTFEFEHSAIGRFQLFIVPISAEAGWVCYQAVFNRFVPPAA